VPAGKIERNNMLINYFTNIIVH